MVFAAVGLPSAILVPVNAVLIIGGAAIDYAALSLSRIALRRFADRAPTPKRAMIFVIEIITIGYLAVGCAMAMICWSAQPIFDLKISELWRPLTPQVLLVVLEQVVAWPFQDVGAAAIVYVVISSHSLLPLAVPACFTTLVFALVTGGAALLYVGRPVLRRPLGEVLDRFASTSGFRSTLAAALASVTAIASAITALLRLKSWSARRVQASGGARSQS